MVAAPIGDAATFAAAPLGVVPPHGYLLGGRNGPPPVVAHDARPRISAPREADIHGAVSPCARSDGLTGSFRGGRLCRCIVD